MVAISMESSDTSDDDYGTEGAPEAPTAPELTRLLALSREESAALRERVQKLEQCLNGILGNAQSVLDPGSGDLPPKSDIKTFVESYGDHLQCSFLHKGQAVGTSLVSERLAYNLSVHLPKGQRLRCQHKNGAAIVDNYNLLQILKQIGFLTDVQTLPYRMTLQRVLQAPSTGQAVDVQHIEPCAPVSFSSKGSKPGPTRLFNPVDMSGKDNFKLNTNSMQCYAGNNILDYANYSTEFRFKLAKGVTSRNSNGATFCLRCVLDIDEVAWESKWATAGLVAPRIPSVITNVFSIRTNSVETQNARDVTKKRKSPEAATTS